MGDNLDAWRYRRRALFLWLIFSALALAYIIGWGRDNELHKTIADALVWGSSANLMAYIAGAVADDTLKRRDTRIVETEKWKSGYYSSGTGSR